MGYAAAVNTFEEFEEVSTLTEKGQTTVPKSVRQALGVGAGDKIKFHVGESGVSLRRADEAREDPALGAFLDFLAHDIQTNPGNLKSLSPDLAKRIADLVDGVEFHPDAPIEGDVDL